jgi:hypothetical protein
MLLRINRNRHNQRASAAYVPQSRKMPGARAIAGLILLSALAVTYKLNSQEPNPAPTADVRSEASQPQDANAPAATHEQQAKKQNIDTAGVERKRQIADDSARLLKLANDLKSEVDKTSKDTLSLGVIRKADEIERLAHNVKEKMKLTLSSN